MKKKKILAKKNQSLLNAILLLAPHNKPIIYDDSNHLYMSIFFVRSSLLIFFFSFSFIFDDKLKMKRKTKKKKIVNFCYKRIILSAFNQIFDVYYITSFILTKMMNKVFFCKQKKDVFLVNIFHFVALKCKTIDRGIKKKCKYDEKFREMNTEFIERTPYFLYFFCCSYCTNLPLFFSCFSKTALHRWFVASLLSVCLNAFL